MNWYRWDGRNNFVLTLHIQPGAKRTEVAGVYGNALKIKLAASPVEGKANAALLKFLSDSFDVPLNQITLKQGAKSRHKVIKVGQSIHGPDRLFQQLSNKLMD
jgi:uncharacterized protein (TIGR00251 family)